ncbi:hypothetical protein Poly51_11830 [Rubripirellula tenax]|uniref:Uncharacterized protein n=1 Tax=Rubripirellula tenax TaxID=2528015 RepID=A0A5C6FH96_9BACT|nr:hypothetical protein Poly51_11830 [Rubripirellula tenax]
MLDSMQWDNHGMHRSGGGAVFSNSRRSPPPGDANRYPTGCAVVALQRRTLGIQALTINRRPVGRLGRVLFRNVEHTATNYSVRSASKSFMLELCFNAFSSACTPGRDVPNGRRSFFGRAGSLIAGHSERRDLQDAARCAVACGFFPVGYLFTAATFRKRTERRHHHLCPLLCGKMMATYRSFPRPFGCDLGTRTCSVAQFPAILVLTLPPATPWPRATADNQDMHRSGGGCIFRLLASVSPPPGDVNRYRTDPSDVPRICLHKRLLQRPIGKLSFGSCVS